MIRHQFSGRLNEAEQRRLNTVGLSDDEIMRKAPAAFATAAHAAVSDRYSFIPTSNIIAGMRRNGFLPVAASQSLVRLPDRTPFAKHMIRFRQQGANLTQVGDSILEMILENAHDTSSRYIVGLGAFRLACTNGLMVADGMFHSIRIKHIGDVVYNVVNSTFELLKQVPRLAEVINAWRALQLSEQEQFLLADAAHELRFPKVPVFDSEGNAVIDAKGEPKMKDTLLGEAIKPNMLLRPNRPDDHGDDLWHVYNRVQENVIRGQRGLAVRGEDGSYRRRSSTEIKGVDSNAALNRGLWKIAEFFAEKKAAN